MIENLDDCQLYLILPVCLVYDKIRLQTVPFPLRALTLLAGTSNCFQHEEMLNSSINNRKVMSSEHLWS